MRVGVAGFFPGFPFCGLFEFEKGGTWSGTESFRCQLVIRVKLILVESEISKLRLGLEFIWLMVGESETLKKKGRGDGSYGELCCCGEFEVLAAVHVCDCTVESVLEHPCYFV